MDAMDRDAEERELAVLRRRAYGPDADIDSDPAARAQLIALEDQLRGRDAGADGGEPVASPNANAPGPAASRRPAWHTALLASCAAAALLLGALAWASMYARDASESVVHLDARTGLEIADPAVAAFVMAPQTRLLLSIPLDGSFGDYVDLPARAVPDLPDASPAQWLDRLGSYYVDQLWIGRAEAGSACLVVEIGDSTRGRCTEPADFDEGSLLLAVSHAELSKRPDGMGPSDSLGFWWRPGGHVDVLVGPHLDGG
ncbi:MAG TPA: hypothetical protein VFN24_06865 [Microbacterium sp.]|nr:hypothetical protein [Microbacterium sp.]